MRYPILTTADATAYLASNRSGTPLDLDLMVKTRGDGPDLPQDFVADLVSDMAAVKARFPEGVQSDKNANAFEALAARAVHQRVSFDPAILSDADFWRWLAVVHFAEIVEWRYGNPANGTKVANYGIGARVENLLYRLWLRAEAGARRAGRRPLSSLRQGADRLLPQPPLPTGLRKRPRVRESAVEVSVPRHQGCRKAASEAWPDS